MKARFLAQWDLVEGGMALVKEHHRNRICLLLMGNPGLPWYQASHASLVDCSPDTGHNHDDCYCLPHMAVQKPLVTNNLRPNRNQIQNDRLLPGREGTKHYG